MEKMTAVQWIAIVLGLLLVISESLPFSQKVKSNGIFQAFISVTKAIYNALKKPA